MKTQLLGAMLILLSSVGIVFAQADRAVQSNLGSAESANQDTNWITEQQQANVQPVSYQIGCASGCCDQPGCADAACQSNCCPVISPRGTDCGPFVPNIIGDSFGVPRVGAIGGTLLNFPIHITKVADNNNVRPYDRLSFTYNLFTDVPQTFDFTGAVQTQNNISEYRVYGEKTVLGGLGSLNIILPIYDTVLHEQTGGPNIATGSEFGNLAFGGKLLLIDRSNMAVSAGLQIEAPTSRDLDLAGNAINNESWYLTPYLASLYTPNDTFFVQSFLSYRARTGSNPVTFRGTPAGLNLYQQDMLLADVATGFWMLRSNGRGITGIAPVLEMHYSTTTEDDDPLTFTSTFYGRRDLLNLTLGTHIEFNQRHMLSLGYALPLRDNPFPPGGMPTDRVFDGEFSIQFNIYR